MGDSVPKRKKASSHFEDSPFVLNNKRAKGAGDGGGGGVGGKSNAQELRRTKLQCHLKIVNNEQLNYLLSDQCFSASAPLAGLPIDVPPTLESESKYPEHKQLFHSVQMAISKPFGNFSIYPNLSADNKQQPDNETFGHQFIVQVVQNVLYSIYINSMLFLDKKFKQVAVPTSFSSFRNNNAYDYPYKVILYDAVFHTRYSAKLPCGVITTLDYTVSDTFRISQWNQTHEQFVSNEMVNLKVTQLLDEIKRKNNRGGGEEKEDNKQEEKKQIERKKKDLPFTLSRLLLALSPFELLSAISDPMLYDRIVTILPNVVPTSLNAQYINFFSSRQHQQVIQHAFGVYAGITVPDMLRFVELNDNKSVDNSSVLTTTELCSVYNAIRIFFRDVSSYSVVTDRSDRVISSAVHFLNAVYYSFSDYELYEEELRVAWDTFCQHCYCNGMRQVRSRDSEYIQAAINQYKQKIHKYSQRIEPLNCLTRYASFKNVTDIFRVYDMDFENGHPLNITAFDLPTNNNSSTNSNSNSTGAGDEKSNNSFHDNSTTTTSMANTKDFAFMGTFREQWSNDMAHVFANANCTNRKTDLNQRKTYQKIVTGAMTSALHLFRTKFSLHSPDVDKELIQFYEDTGPLRATPLLFTKNFACSPGIKLSAVDHCLLSIQEQFLDAGFSQASLMAVVCMWATQIASLRRGQTRPIISLYGAHGSGKSFLLSLMLEIFKIRGAVATTSETDGAIKNGTSDYLGGKGLIDEGTNFFQVVHHSMEKLASSNTRNAYSKGANEAKSFVSQHGARRACVQDSSKSHFVAKLNEWFASTILVTTSNVPVTCVDAAMQSRMFQLVVLGMYNDHGSGFNDRRHEGVIEHAQAKIIERVHHVYTLMTLIYHFRSCGLIRDNLTLVAKQQLQTFFDMLVNRRTSRDFYRISNNPQDTTEGNGTVYQSMTFLKARDISPSLTTAQFVRLQRHMYRLNFNMFKKSIQEFHRTSSESQSDIRHSTQCIFSDNDEVDHLCRKFTYGLDAPGYLESEAGLGAMGRRDVHRCFNLAENMNLTDAVLQIFHGNILGCTFATPNPFVAMSARVEEAIQYNWLHALKYLTYPEVFSIPAFSLARSLACIIARRAVLDGDSGTTVYYDSGCDYIVLNGFFEGIDKEKRLEHLSKQLHESAGQIMLFEAHWMIASFCHIRGSGPVGTHQLISNSFLSQSEHKSLLISPYVLWLTSAISNALSSICRRDSDESVVLHTWKTQFKKASSLDVLTLGRCEYKQDSLSDSSVFKTPFSLHSAERIFATNQQLTGRNGGDGGNSQEQRQHQEQLLNIVRPTVQDAHDYSSRCIQSAHTSCLFIEEKKEEEQEADNSMMVVDVEAIIGERKQQQQQLEFPFDFQDQDEKNKQVDNNNGEHKNRDVGFNPRHDNTVFGSSNFNAFPTLMSSSNLVRLKALVSSEECTSIDLTTFRYYLTKLVSKTITQREFQESQKNHQVRKMLFMYSKTTFSVEGENSMYKFDKFVSDELNRKMIYFRDRLAGECETIDTHLCHIRSSYLPECKETHLETKLALPNKPSLLVPCTKDYEFREHAATESKIDYASVYRNTQMAIVSGVPLDFSLTRLTKEREMELMYGSQSARRHPCWPQNADEAMYHNGTIAAMIKPLVDLFGFQFCEEDPQTQQLYFQSLHLPSRIPTLPSSSASASAPRLLDNNGNKESIYILDASYYRALTFNLLKQIYEFMVWKCKLNGMLAPMIDDVFVYSEITRLDVPFFKRPAKMIADHLVSYKPDQQLFEEFQQWCNEVICDTIQQRNQRISHILSDGGSTQVRITQYLHSIGKSFDSLKLSMYIPSLEDIPFSSVEIDKTFRSFGADCTPLLPGWREQAAADLQIGLGIGIDRQHSEEQGLGMEDDRQLVNRIRNRLLNNLSRRNNNVQED